MILLVVYVASSGSVMACGVTEDALNEIIKLRNLLNIAYDHLLGAGYERDGVTLQKLETGCNPVSDC